MELHRDNILTQYVTALTQRLGLSDQWECGIVEIQHLHSWYNVKGEDAWFGLARTDAYGITANGRIEVGYYDGPAKLIRPIYNTMADIMVDKK